MLAASPGNVDIVLPNEINTKDKPANTDHDRTTRDAGNDTAHPLSRVSTPSNGVGKTSGVDAASHTMADDERDASMVDRDSPIDPDAQLLVLDLSDDEEEDDVNVYVLFWGTCLIAPSRRLCHFPVCD